MIHQVHSLKLSRDNLLFSENADQSNVPILFGLDDIHRVQEQFFLPFMDYKGLRFTHLLSPPSSDPRVRAHPETVVSGFALSALHLVFKAWDAQELPAETTGARFHPIEIIMSMGIKLAAVALLGPPALAVLVFEVLLNATSMFNHSNVRIPLNIDKVLRFLVVTPDMHRVHHSVIRHETDSNFGFNLPWWDRLFGTYRDQPSAGHEGMTIGLSQFRDPERLTLPWMLALPFIGKPGNYAINRWGREPELKK